MVIGLLTVSIHIPESQSLKTKRRVLRSVKDRIRSRFNVSLAELEDHDKWQKTHLGIVTIGQDKKEVNGVLSRVLDLIQDHHTLRLLDHTIEMM